jgi:flagellin
VIDGGGSVSADMKANVFSDPTAQNPTGLERINKMRAYIGAMTNRLEHTINNLMNQETNTQSAESVIRDVDFANETARYTRNQILTQSSTAMLAQANTATQQVLQLLQ